MRGVFVCVQANSFLCAVDAHNAPPENCGGAYAMYGSNIKVRVAISAKHTHTHKRTFPHAHAVRERQVCKLSAASRRCLAMLLCVAIYPKLVTREFSGSLWCACSCAFKAFGHCGASTQKHSCLSAIGSQRIGFVSGIGHRIPFYGRV